jgi:hypothetical protein
MKTMMLAAAAVMSLGMASAFAATQPTIVFTNGSTYDSHTGLTSAPHGLCNGRSAYQDGCAACAALAER